MCHELNLSISIIMVLYSAQTVEWWILFVQWIRKLCHLGSLRVGSVCHCEWFAE